MVNRYAASGQFENKVARDRGIEVRYIVMAPSSYVYFNGQRAAKGSSTQFSIPDNPPDRYNCWGYGMESLFVFHRKHKISPEKIINDYPAKRILYLVGSKDNDQNDASLDKKPPAMLQGRDRRERAKVYYNYLKHFYGQKIKGNQYFKIVKNAGHSGRQLMLSRQAILFTFAPNRKR